MIPLSLIHFLSLLLVKTPQVPGRLRNMVDEISYTPISILRWSLETLFLESSNQARCSP